MWGGLNVSIFIPYIFWILYCLTDHERERRGHLQRWGPGQAPWGRGSCCEAWQRGSNRHTMSTQTFWPWTWSQTLEWWKTVTNNHKSQIIQHNTILFLDISSNQWNQGLFYLQNIINVIQMLVKESHVTAKREWNAWIYSKCKIKGTVCVGGTVGFHILC